ncbi:MAG: TrlF family AAA-like ATPase [Candidatus Thorarchaeota archaeon]
MNYSKFPKGSQWRKWDLHVHTPASFHWNGGKRLWEMSAEEKSASFSTLLTTIEETDIAVYAFTDYWTFDGFLEFREFLASNDLVCSKVVFPGIELRVEAPVDYRLNIQVICSDSLSNQQLRDFKSRLILRNLNRPLSREAIIEFAKTLDPSKAKHHGAGDPSSLSDEELLLLGSMTVEITKSSLEAAIQALPKGTAYIVLPYDTSDGLEGLDWKSQPQADNYFMQTAHAFESRSSSTTNLFKGIETPENRDFIENFQITLGRVAKPVICGSDAHKYTEYGAYPSNRITWIRADPCFQGFRQIFFEPDERVAIQELAPQEKVPYLVIDKVKFIDRSGSDLFENSWIEINECLNTIIGGKSSGKSLLVYHIVRAISPDLLDRRSKEITIPQYSFGPDEVLDFEVQWADGHIDKISSDSQDAVREIEYIPQMYVNSLAEEKGKDSLFSLIESILIQNDTYREFITRVNGEIASLEGQINQDLVNLLRLREDVRKLYRERREIGVKSAIDAEILRLRERIGKLESESGFTPEERNDYERLQRSLVITEGRISRYSSLQSSTIELGEALERSKSSLAAQLKRVLAEIPLDDFGKRIVPTALNESISKILDEFSIAISSITLISQNAEQKITGLQIKAARIKKQCEPFEIKVRDQKLLKTLTESLKAEQAKLKQYNAKEERIKSVTEAGVQTRENLLCNYSKLFNSYQKIVAKLKDDEFARIDEEILLEASLSFNLDKFEAAFCDLFDRRGSFSTEFGSCFDDNNSFLFDEASHLKTIISIFETLSASNETLSYKQGASDSNAISQLFKNYFEIEYNVTYKDDDILEMSPGKRGLVLLQLILHISNAIHPILIDQPEDNLDNRTISTDLRDFIKLKKAIRQIIMVTHDANLVVLTDAENVIVSNQAGQQADRENKKYRFEYVSGSLEHSFREENLTGLGVLQSCGIREHICDVLEGGEEAFRKREQRYGFADV